VGATAYSLLDTQDQGAASDKSMISTLPSLPALKHMGELADRRPVVVVDTREQDPLPIRRLPVIRGGLYSGDYSIAAMETMFAVERKSIPDLVSCCAGSNRDRFEHELHRLRGFRFKRLLIIGTRAKIERGDYRSNIKPSSVLGSLAAWEIRFDIPVVFALDPEAGAVLVERWAWYFAREQVQIVNNVFRNTTQQQQEDIAS
jgi:DNA excision repair protein ERCC-4